jgi:hypothetical protein
LNRSKGGRVSDQRGNLDEPRVLRSPQDSDALFGLAGRGVEGSRVVQALIRRIVEIQDVASEAELLALVSQVRELMDGGATSH